MESRHDCHAACMQNHDPSPATPGSLFRELEAIYERADADIQQTGAPCFVRGVCCDFETAEHVLYASSVEIAWVQEGHPEASVGASPLCPFWKDGLCTERERRPLGCRTYFCDPAYRDRVGAVYEKHHAAIRESAVRHGVEYRYEPFVAALRGAGESRQARSPAKNDRHGSDTSTQREI